MYEPEVFPAGTPPEKTYNVSLTMSMSGGSKTASVTEPEMFPTESELAP